MQVAHTATGGRDWAYVALAEVGAVRRVNAAERVPNLPEGHGAAVRARTGDGTTAVAPTCARGDGGEGGADILGGNGLTGQMPSHGSDEGLEAHARGDKEWSRILDLLHHAAGGRDAWERGGVGRLPHPAQGPLGTHPAR